LWWAARENDVALVLVLLRQGAEVEWRNADGWTPLAVACTRGSYEAAEALCAHGAELDTRCDWQITPLIHAALHGHPKICEMLVALGADPSLKSNSGRTALDIAQEQNKSECVALLQPITPGS
jgi:ankyrin repeat protein